MVARPLGYSSDFLIQVAKGEIPRHSLVHKFGRNDATPTSWELVASKSTVPYFPSTPTTVRIKAGGNAADTAAGAGAREITVEGIDDSLAYASETIATAGASASSSTTTSFWRVHRLFASQCGDYDAPFNVDDIVIEDTAGANDLIMLMAEESQTQYCLYSVASGYTAYLLTATVTVDANQSADFRILTRENFDNTTPPVSARRLRHYWDGVSGEDTYPPKGPAIELVGPADIWVEAQSGAGSAEVTSNLEMLLVQGASSIELHLTEYGPPPTWGRAAMGPMSEPNEMNQTVSFSGGATQSGAFGQFTRYIRFVSDADCYIAFGANPTATTSSEKIMAGIPEWRSVRPGHRISVIEA